MAFTQESGLLAHEKFGSTPHSARRLTLIVHGIFGAGRNWRGFARSLAAAEGECVVAVDLRNHGASRLFEGPHDLPSCGRDLMRLGEAFGRIPDRLIGHSFGGKVVLEATLCGGWQPSQTWVLDCPIGRPHPDEPAPLDSEVGRLLVWLEQRPLPIARRSEVTEDLLAAGFQRGVSTWMATNLRPAERGGYTWAFDLGGVREMLTDYWRRDYYLPLEEGRPLDRDFFFVWGTRSDRWEERDLARLRALDERAGISVKPLEGAGHWLHVDRPDELLALIRDEPVPARGS